MKGKVLMGIIAGAFILGVSIGSTKGVNDEISSDANQNSSIKEEIIENPSINKENTDTANNNNAYVQDNNTNKDASPDNSEDNAEIENKVEIEHRSNGSFQGFADSSFIEVKEGDNYTVYNTLEPVRNTLHNIDIGTEIYFIYKELQGSKTIIDIIK